MVITDLFKDFICIEIEYNDSEYSQIVKKFRLKEPTYPTSLFISHNQQFLQMIFNKSTSRNEEYIEAASQAIKRNENPPLSAFGRKYSMGNYDINFL